MGGLGKRNISTRLTVAKNAKGERRLGKGGKMKEGEEAELSDRKGGSHWRV